MEISVAALPCLVRKEPNEQCAAIHLLSREQLPKSRRPVRWAVVVQRERNTLNRFVSLLRLARSMLTGMWFEAKMMDNSEAASDSPPPCSRRLLRSCIQECCKRII